MDSIPRGYGVLHYGVRRGCAPVLGSFWPEIPRLYPADRDWDILLLENFCDWGML